MVRFLFGIVALLLLVPAYSRTAQWVQRRADGGVSVAVKEHQRDESERRLAYSQPLQNPRIPEKRTPDNQIEPGSIESLHVFFDSTTIQDNQDIGVSEPKPTQEKPNSDSSSGDEKNRRNGKVIFFTMALGLGIAFMGYRYMRKKRFQHAGRTAQHGLQSYGDVYDNLHDMARFKEIPMVPVRTSSHQAPFRPTSFV